MADGFAYSTPSAVPADEQDAETRALRKRLELAQRRFEADLSAIDFDFPDWTRGRDEHDRVTYRRVFVEQVD